MRFETQQVSAYLVRQMIRTHSVDEVIHDGGDNILLRLSSGELVSLYLIERHQIEVYELKGMVSENHAAGVHTLFILWAELLLPSEGRWYRPDDWMRELMTLYGDKIYGYDRFGDEVFVFPVHFEGSGRDRLIRYGTMVSMADLHTETAHVQWGAMAGTWRVAHFTRTETHHAKPPEPEIKVSIDVHYQRLGILPNANREAIKRAYRKLAMEYHPDLNSTPEAHDKMLQINEAYDTIIRRLNEKR